MIRLEASALPPSKNCINWSLFSCDLSSGSKSSLSQPRAAQVLALSHASRGSESNCISSSMFYINGVLFSIAKMFHTNFAENRLRSFPKKRKTYFGTCFKHVLIRDPRISRLNFNVCQPLDHQTDVRTKSRHNHVLYSYRYLVPDRVFRDIRCFRTNFLFSEVSNLPQVSLVFVGET